ncbi:winged helix-turn-helix domain-containing protein [Actinokineospora auranticolor]|uniref:Helix-turn-helix protein n=1 Tax=Actinokineospora auranticolor TaxID=155976 RepID=A0A2S6GY15_9PSEU|nr:winged helix-turn-helix domain-containing protein [Actinokineospora auranticolor]PPK70124.1 helix-turn-helix protein [Actinokineospora auranticolor]
MITAYLDAAAVGNVRLAISPAIEAISWLRLTVAGRTHPIYGDPGAAARFALRDPDVRMIAGTMPRGLVGYMPDLLSPSPAFGDPDRAWLDQVERMAATSPEDAEWQVAATDNPSAEAMAAVDDGTFARRAADAMTRFWSVAMADSWSGLRDRLQADLVERARVMATEGVGTLLSSLHTNVRWTGAAVEITKPYSHPITLNGLVLSPAALSWPTLLVQMEDPDDAVISYPANGLGIPENPDRDAVARLMGPTRANLLRDLDTPRSTTDLSRRHGLAAATVSYHLSVLHDSGLVTKSRHKRTVLYQRNDHHEVLR